MPDHNDDKTNLPALTGDELDAMIQETETDNGLGGLPMLKFDRGKPTMYILNGEDIEVAGHTYFALVTSWARGWILFQDGGVVDRKIRRRPGDIVPDYDARDALDPPAPPKGQKDCWLHQDYLPMVDTETGKVMVFVTPSFGGRKAVRPLVNMALKEYKKRDIKTLGAPIVTLGIGSMDTKSFGDVPCPEFTHIGWELDLQPSPKSDMDDEIPF